MVDIDLPVMGPADGASYRVVGLRCWARRGNLSLFGRWLDPWSPYGTACGAEPATDLGLCAHHLAAVFSPEIRHAPRP